jgi:hypothetical protein
MRLRAALLLPLLVVLMSCLAEEQPCACTYPAEAVAYELYVMDGPGADARLVPVRVEDAPSGNPGMVALPRLLALEPKGRKVNAWHGLQDEPFTEVVAVEHRRGVVTVHLSEDPWDPYPTVDLASQVDGGLAVQQLVWTVTEAIGTVDPVRVVVGGREVRGVWLHRVDWPVAADPDVLADRR